jgi:hypothetical protein
LTVAGTSRNAALELVKRLEQSPSFREARIVEESAIQSNDSPDTVQFHVTAVYVPRNDTTADRAQAETRALPAPAGGRQMRGATKDTNARVTNIRVTSMRIAQARIAGVRGGAQ